MIVFTKGLSQVSFTEFERTSNATKKLSLSHELWEYYLRNNSDSLKQLAISTQELGIKKNSEPLKMFSQRIIGCYLVRNGDFVGGEIALKKALIYHQKNGDIANVTEDFNELGISNFLKGDYHSAESFFKLSLKSGKESPDETHQFLAELNLAKTYDKLDLKEKAKAIASEYLEECKKLNKMESVASAYGLLSDLALNEKKIVLSEEYLSKSLNASKSTNNNSLKAQIHSNFGAFYAAKEDFLKAKEHFNQALEFRLKTNHHKGVLEAYYNLGSVEYVENNFSAAETFYLKGLGLAKEFNLFSDQIDFLEVLVEIQKEKKDKDKEIKFYQELIDVKSKQAEFLIKNKEEQANLIDYFEENENNTKSEIVKQSNFWSGFLVGMSSLLVLLIIIRFFRPKLVSTEKQQYDE
jgi:tetratricopeptide (TPR) repeat protein